MTNKRYRGASQQTRRSTNPPKYALYMNGSLYDRGTKTFLRAVIDNYRKQPWGKTVRFQVKRIS